MNKNLNSPDSPAPHDDATLRWRMLGLGTGDVTSAENANEYEAGLHRQIIGHPDEDREKPKRFSRRVAIVAVGMLMLLISGVSVRLAMAQQNQRVSREYASNLLTFVLQLYAEDVGVMKQLSLKAESELPQVSLIGLNQSNQVRMNFCASAIEGLTLVRMGFPEQGMERLLLAEEALALNQEDVELHLDLAFHVIAGKSLYEAVEVTGGKIEGVPSLFEGFDSAMRHALQVIDSGSINLDQEKARLLKAAILIDMARSLVKRSSGATPEALAILEKGNADLNAARELLFQSNSRQSDWLVQFGRLINNQLLLDTRKNLYDSLPIEIESVVHDYSTKLESFEQFVENVSLDEGENENAIHFEFAMICSNLADFIAQQSNPQQPSPQSGDWQAEELKLRGRAIEHLLRIPRECRTVRHFENLAINRARRVAAQVIRQSFNSERVPISLAYEAVVLEAFLGDDLLQTKRIGQLKPESVLAGAIVLSSVDPSSKSKYSLKALDAYFKANSFRIRAFERKWFDNWLRQQIDKDAG